MEDLAWSGESESRYVGIRDLTSGLQNHKPKPCQGDEVSPTNDVIHTDGMFSGKMKNALIGGLEYNINLLQEAFKTKITKLRIYERMGVGAIGMDVEIKGMC